MPRLSLGLGVQTIRKVGGGGAAPSGIVAATAGNLIITFAYFNDTTYTKISNTLWKFDFGDGEYQRLEWNGLIPNTWTLDVNNGDPLAVNPSTNYLIIPTTGWIYTINSGPSITITAA